MLVAKNVGMQKKMLIQVERNQGQKWLWRKKADRTWFDNNCSKLRDDQDFKR